MKVEIRIDTKHTRLWQIDCAECGHRYGVLTLLSADNPAGVQPLLCLYCGMRIQPVEKPAAVVA